MTLAISKAVEEGSKAVVCASTGNTSASAAAYAAKAGLTCAVAAARRARSRWASWRRRSRTARSCCRWTGTSTRRSTSRASWPAAQPVTLVNSVNPFRLQGQKTLAFEVCDALGRAPDYHLLPVGNAGNIASHWMGYREYLRDGVIARAARACSGSRRPARRRSCSAHPVAEPDDDRHGHPDREPGVVGARREGRRDESEGRDPRRHRPRDPPRLPPDRPRGGAVRRAGLGRVGRRAAAARRRGPPRPRLHRRLRPDRARAEGAGLGHRRRGEARTLPADAGRRRRRARPEDDA